MKKPPYRGRFAPSPTGPLHFGSLVAALGSYLEARTQWGQWLVRIEDVDATRCRPEYEAAILRTLDSFGFRYDHRVMRQSERAGAYQKALNRLFHEAPIFACACTRKEIGDSRVGSDGAPIYPGTCRVQMPEGKEARAWRIRVNDHVFAFEDAIQGHIEQNLATEVGDFVLLRADGMFAYQLAVIVDDAEQEITHVVRGADLIDSTPRQIYLQERLGVPTPQYAHLPVAVGFSGEKLSKQTLAVPLEDDKPVPALWQAMHFLGQQPPEDLRKASVSEFWEWAMHHWTLDKVPKIRSIIIE
ncbi:MAG: tRNA glutamyl-Q(34) synthetase GluQRS [Oxalobacter sp.]|nr:MAG: tRNA glutamyl-Q(34) synthetase GluQRS [Oxalobacter sp.]